MSWEAISNDSTLDANLETDYDRSKKLQEKLSYCNECGETYVDEGLGCPDCDWQGEDDEVTDEDVENLFNAFNHHDQA